MNYKPKNKSRLNAIGLFCFISMISIKSQPYLNFGELTKIADGFNFVEGPVWIDDLGLLFSDIPENKVYLYDLESNVSTYLSPSGKSNGLALDANNNLILAQHYDRQVGLLESDMTITPLATTYDGMLLNSPNDLAIKSDGSIFFTDPPFGLNDEGRTSETGFAGIYRLASNGDVQLLDSTLNYPNGIAFSPDETKLYVTESDMADVYVWDVIDDTTITNKTLFYDIPGMWGDGMKVDLYGNLFVTGPKGLWVFDPEANLLKSINLPGGSASNCGWGDEDRQTLYITSGDAVYSIRIEYSDTLPGENTGTNQGGIYETKNIKLSKLLSIYPNPIVNIAEIPFYLHKASDVKIELLNTAGIKIRTILQNRLSSGNHYISWYATNEPAGMYIISLTTDNCVDLLKCTLVK